MNIKFAQQALRCRVTRAELELLLVGRAIALDVRLPRDHAFRANVRPAVTGPWQLESDPTGLWLTIPRSELEGLAKSLPNKEGIEHVFALANGESLTVDFEVDVRDRARTSIPAT
jgi:hypothetical protein